MSNRNIITRESGLKFLREKSVIVAVAIAALIMASGSDYFYTEYNATLILQKVAMIAFASIGMTMLIMIGEIDLSIGSMVGIGGVSCIALFNSGMPMTLAVIITLVFALGLGLASGVIISCLKIPSFLITLVMAQLVRMLAFAINGGIESVTAYNATDEVKFLGTAKIGMFPVSVIIAIALYILMWFILAKTGYGRYVRALSGNSAAARLLCVPSTKIKISIFALSAMFTAFAGIINASRLRIGIVNSLSINWEIDTIAAVLIGGTLYYSGEGNFIFTFIGAFFIAIINASLGAMTLPSFVTTIIKCLIILAVLIIHSIFRVKAEKLVN